MYLCVVIDRPGRDETSWLANLHTGDAHILFRLRLGAQERTQKPPPAWLALTTNAELQYVAWPPLVLVLVLALVIDRARLSRCYVLGSECSLYDGFVLFVRGKSVSLLYSTSLCGERCPAAQQGCVCICV